MKTMRILIVATILIISFTRCGLGKFNGDANKRFGDQHFKTAIALIELYKVRYGVYPATLDSIKYAGDWDQMAWTSVEYQKLDTGYVLNLTGGLLGMPDSLSYPNDFWQGLGLVRSNIKR